MISGYSECMKRSTALAQVIGDQIRCTVKTPSGKAIVVSGAIDSINPSIEGSPELSRNQALVSNAWAFALCTAKKVLLSTEEEQNKEARTAKVHHGTTIWIAEYIDQLTGASIVGWCSSCICHSEHFKVKRPVGVLPTWLCDSCGSPTVACMVPNCPNMASKNFKAGQDRKYCAEHRHDIPSFEHADDAIESLNDYKDFMSYSKPNFARGTKLIAYSALGAIVVGPLSLVAAPAIGGAAGALVGGYSGAAATSFGLAWLGGGSLAAGGLGMAGGTMVLTAVGSALGSGLSASITNSYVQEDKSFHIEMLKGGTGVPVVVCNGFLSERGRGWGEWKKIVTERYPDSPVYRVHWGAKELKHIGFVARDGAVRGGLPVVVQGLAAQAGREAAKRLGPVGPLLAAAEAARNPWHVARNRADKTGIILADILARSLEGPFVLIGHSLGARIVTVAAQALSSRKERPQIETIHLLGNAIRSNTDWEKLAGAVNEKVYNYHSGRDQVLKKVYFVAQGGQSAAGYSGFVLPERAKAKIENINVTEQVDGHSKYQEHVKLR